MLVHDWVFLEQYLAASLTMPIAVSIFRGATDISPQMKRVKTVMLYANVAFYTVTLGWFLVSVITTKFFWRMSMDVITLTIASVFLTSFYQIGKVIRRENFRQGFVPSKQVIMAHLIVIFSEVSIFSVILVMIIFYNSAIYNLSDGVPDENLHEYA